MKKLCITTGILLMSMSMLFAQVDPVQEIMQPLEAANDAVFKMKCDTSKGMIITNRAFNLLMSNTLGNYLSEGGDISLFGAYATLDSKGELSINKNFVKMKSLKNESKVNHLFTLGFKGDISEGFSEIYSKGAWKSGFAATAKWSWMIGSSITFDKCNPGGQKERMDFVRAKLLAQICEEAQKEVTEYETSLGKIDKALTKLSDDDFNKTVDKNRISHNSKLINKYSKRFAELQVEAFEDEELEAYNKYAAHWISVITEIPFNQSKYYVSESLTSNFNEKKLYKAEASLRYNYVTNIRKEIPNRFFKCFPGTWFFSVSAGIAGNNSISTELLDEYDRSKYLSAGGLDSIKFNSLKKDDKIFVGEYKSFVSGIFRAQTVYFPACLSLKTASLGFNFEIEHYAGRHFKPMNIKLGIPIRLNDKDGDPTVNFEPQIKFQDVYGNSGKARDNLIFGISVGLPFGSIIY